jgi:hypothetical protein
MLFTRVIPNINLFFNPDNLAMTDFFKLYKLYRVAHGRRYALRRAYEITFKGVPF